MKNELYIWICVGVIALVTALTRFLPFLVYSSESATPKYIIRLGALLPYSIMGMLVVYCLKDVKFNTGVEGFLPELISVAIVALIHLWRKNTLFSIISGTLCYMLLVQLVF